MVFIKNRIIQFLIIISAIILIDLISFELALPADDTQIIIGENIKPGMSLKDAVELLGTPEKIKVIDKETILIPYNRLGLSIEIRSDETVIRKIHVDASFKGRFASGIEIGTGFQDILSKYNQPDIMTKEIIEYSHPAMRLQIVEGKLTGAEISLAAGTMPDGITDKKSVKIKEAAKELPEEVHQEVSEEVKAELREEVKAELREELREEVLEEVNREVTEDFDVFDLFGFKVKNSLKGVIITEIRPGSVAENGGLKTGEQIRKAFYDESKRLNIFSVNGLEAILRRSIVKRKKIINILQDKNYYYKVEVPKIK